MTIPEGRVKNLSGGEVCPDCADDGFAVAALRPSHVRPEPEYAYEEMGPCPTCEKGFQIEFPTAPAVGPWGPKGYWRGRPASVIKSPPRDPKPAPLAYNREKWNEVSKLMRLRTLEH